MKIGVKHSFRVNSAIFNGTVMCISLETHSVASQPSVAVGWVKIKIWSMPHSKGLTANFKLM